MEDKKVTWKFYYEKLWRVDDADDRGKLPHADLTEEIIKGSN